MIHQIVFHAFDELFISHKKQGKGCLKIPFSRPQNAGAFSTRYAPFFTNGSVGCAKTK
jgi:hypothetical protein